MIMKKSRLERKIYSKEDITKEFLEPELIKSFGKFISSDQTIKLLDTIEGHLPDEIREIMDKIDEVKDKLDLKLEESRMKWEWLTPAVASSEEWQEFLRKLPHLPDKQVCMMTDPLANWAAIAAVSAAVVAVTMIVHNVTDSW